MFRYRFLFCSHSIRFVTFFFVIIIDEVYVYVFLLYDYKTWLIQRQIEFYINRCCNNNNNKGIFNFNINFCWLLFYTLISAETRKKMNLDNLKLTQKTKKKVSKLINGDHMAEQNFHTQTYCARNWLNNSPWIEWRIGIHHSNNNKKGSNFSFFFYLFWLFNLYFLYIITYERCRTHSHNISSMVYVRVRLN